MARYRVQRHPGAQVPGVGFIVPGKEFTAPEGYAPSKTFLPLDSSAQEELAKVFAQEKARLEELLGNSKGDGDTVRILRGQLKQRLDELEKQRLSTLELAPAAPPPAKKDDGLTVAELGKKRAADR